MKNQKKSTAALIRWEEERKRRSADPNRITQVEAAKAVGVSTGLISLWIKRGMLKRHKDKTVSKSEVLAISRKRNGNPDLVLVNQAAKRLRVSVSAIKRQLASGAIKYLNGKHISMSELERLLAAPADAVSTDAAAALAGVEIHTINKWIRAGILRSFGLRGARRVSADELELIVRGRREPMFDRVALYRVLQIAKRVLASPTLSTSREVELAQFANHIIRDDFGLSEPKIPTSNSEDLFS